MEKMAHVKAQVTCRFQASPERVFDAWLNPEFATRWLFTSPGSDRIGRRVEMDPRVGGKYVIVDRRNGTDYVGDGEYEEIDRPRRLVFTFRMAQFSPTIDRVIVEIEPLEDGCQLTLVQEIVVPHRPDATSEEVRQMLAACKSETEHGWNEMFDHLLTLL
ncbi:SRPBCC family protein [Cohnella nanjingensis]|uniref:SRPBCC domain-containing protein n=1 Tax=Cohnella nanjingensis TaxID=1387779 RepID=A0A7X0VJ58_9BACL|nr:SRPBCC domain-containing protein [Cohnella nanjingensis]MBB6675218.1 SRPBCC domain-containing protein [Cohnella nanjingensis]